MQSSTNQSELHNFDTSKVVLAIDACGLRGTVALVRALDGGLELIGKRELPERNEAATILGAIEELLVEAGLAAQEIGAVLVVDGPGSFTGVRIGVSTALGLSEGLGVPIARISRLEVLAGLGGCEASVLDAHRGEVYLRADAGECVERLADVEALKLAGLAGLQVAVCNVAVAELVRTAVPDVKLVDCLEPTALDAVKIAWPRILAGEFAEPLKMDGNYLRRSDAEIFSKAARGQSQSVAK
jgi:tRNA threonylcarbamoyladenosine biosynthesis protein TsaB